MLSTGVVAFPVRRRYRRQQVLDLVHVIEDAPVPAMMRAEVVSVVRRLCQWDTDGSPWAGGFVMLNAMQVQAIWIAIRALPKEDLPSVCRDAFMFATCHMRHDTGEVLLTQRELAALVRTTPKKISHAMGVLTRLGVVLRSYRTIPGVRGRQVVYAINPHVGWKGSLEARSEAAADSSPPLLRLMDGGEACEASPA